MDALHDHGGFILEALNAKVYGNNTETLVLSHGYGTDQSIWHYVIPYLATFFKVVVFDLVFAPNVNPNLFNPMKYSSFNGYARDLISILDELNLNKTIYMGHSMSAMIGCTATIMRPDLFQHLVLLGGSPRHLNSEGYNGGFERSELHVIFKSMDKNFSSWVRSIAPMAIAVNNTGAITEFENSLGRMKPKIALSVAKTVFLSNQRHMLPRVSEPCTIILSRRDPIVPQFVAYYMAEKLGVPATVKILKTDGHFPQLTAYSLLLKALRAANVIN